MENNNIILHSIAPADLKEMLQEMIQAQFEEMNKEIQSVIGEDDLVSSGTACRLLGICSKVLKILTDQGHFTVYYHLKERRYNRGELLIYRNRHRASKRQH